MATEKTKGILAIIFGVIILAVGTFLLVIGVKSKNETAFEYIKRKGAVASTIFPGSFEMGGYRFFSNNRVVRLSDGAKGSYTIEKITLDNGTIVVMSTIFK